MKERKPTKKYKRRIIALLAVFIIIGNKISTIINRGKDISSRVIFLNKKKYRKLLESLSKRLSLILHHRKLKKQKRRQLKKLAKQEKLHIRAVYKTTFNLEEIVARFISETQIVIKGIIPWEIIKKSKEKHINKELANEISPSTQVSRPIITQEHVHEVRLNIKALNEINLEIEDDFPNLSKLVKQVAAGGRRL